MQMFGATGKPFTQQEPQRKNRGRTSLWFISTNQQRGSFDTLFKALAERRRGPGADLHKSRWKKFLLSWSSQGVFKTTRSRKISSTREAADHNETTCLAAVMTLCSTRPSQEENKGLLSCVYFRGLMKLMEHPRTRKLAEVTRAVQDFTTRHLLIEKNLIQDLTP